MDLEILDRVLCHPVWEHKVVFEKGRFQEEELYWVREPEFQALVEMYYL